MNYEDKYNEALKWMRSLYDGLHGATKEDAEHYFPELKESEDEKIRKWCISHFKECINVIKDNDEYKEYLSNNVIAWLEKQGEQKLYVNDNAKEMFIKALERVEEQNSKGYKLTDYDKNSWWEDFKAYSFEQNLANSAKTCKAEPKFKVGDWVVNKFGYVWHIDSFDEKNYQVSNEKGDDCYFKVSKQDEFHPWTIQDAKDGDVIASGNCIFIFDRIENNWIKVHGTVHKDGSVICENYGLMTTKYSNETFPATKEQRDKLFQKMEEAGYEWNAEKKELTKIEQKSVEEINGNIEKVSSVWSEEDEKNMKEIDSLIWSYCPIRGVVYDRLHAWLKSLKERLQPQNNLKS